MHFTGGRGLFFCLRRRTGSRSERIRVIYHVFVSVALAVIGGRGALAGAEGCGPHPLTSIYGRA